MGVADSSAQFSSREGVEHGDFGLPDNLLGPQSDLLVEPIEIQPLIGACHHDQPVAVWIGDTSSEIFHTVDTYSRRLGRQLQ